MKHLRKAVSLSADGRAVVASVGMFDGLHCGHLTLLSQLRQEAEKYGGTYALITFSPHPRTFFSKEPLALLTTEEEKIARLQALGLPQLITLDFDYTLANLSSHAFLDLLSKQLQVSLLVVGPDHRFGKGRAGNFDTLLAYGKQRENNSFQAKACEACFVAGRRVSSSAIRECLAQGDIAQANALLGYPYAFSGRVGRGEGLARTIDYPTINLEAIPASKLLPADGVYAVHARLKNDVENNWHHGMLYIGDKRIGGRSSGRTIEVHLFDFEGSLYSQWVELRVLAYLRSAVSFKDLSALAHQLTKDAAAARVALLRAPQGG